jgi:vitamin B12 transporter
VTPLRRLSAVCLAALLWAPAAALAAPGDPFEHLYFSGDELVESATRSPKPLSQVAENVAVVTAAEIRDMNAHTLAEVLNRVTGVFVQFFGVHPGATALPHIQGSGETNPFRRGSEERHVTVLVDGMPWSSQTSGALLDTIPVGIIDRIEVVKGPASSAWGSSLGGVVNVITKQPGRTPVPSGAVQGSYGERGAYDVRGEAAGGAGPLGYYLQGQAQGFDWDDAGADFLSRSAFAKASARLAPTAALTLSGGYANRDLDNGHLAS